MKRSTRQQTLGEIGPMWPVSSILDELDRSAASMQAAERTAEAAGLPKMAGHFRSIRTTVEAMHEEILARLRGGGTRHRTIMT